MQSKVIEGFRLSPQQRRLWSLQQDSPVYHAQCALLLEGDLQTEIFRQSVQAVVNRHEILRTTFHLPRGMKVPFQVIRDSIPSWHRVDLTRLSAKEQEAKIEDFFQEQGRFLFDFDQGPLLHFSLLALSEQKHVLLVCLPSLCADVASLENLVCEISQCYAARLAGKEVSSEKQRYVQFSEWQNQLLEAEHEGKDYWRKPGSPALPALQLPFENHSREKPGFNPEFLTLAINPDIVAEIAVFIRKYDTSILVFLLACWQTLLWRLTGQPDVLIATVFDGRKFEELRGALGLFARSLPILAHFEPDSQFTEILSQVREATRDACEWQEYFTTEMSAGSREESPDSALFPISFEFTERLPKHDAAGVSFSIYGQRACIDRFKIKLYCVQTADSLVAEFHYDSHLFLADDAERLAKQFHTLLKSALNDPETAISKLEILSDVERQRLLVEWNNTKTRSPKETCIHQLFEQQAAQTPDNVAVVYEDQQLTYKELNGRANQLARYLLGFGVGPETPVALCVERSLEMVIGLLGVLKAAGAYVPLDPVLPRERLAFMLEDTQAPVLLTQQMLVGSLPEHKGKLVCLDTDWNKIAQQSRENISSEATSRNLAYLLFTSGSTGNPKGVAVEHRQLLNYLAGILQRLDLPAGASFATVSTFAADLGNTAIFPSLCSGGSLHVVSQETASDPNALADYFARYPVDCLKIVPSHLEVLMTSSCPERILPRKRLVLGGEAANWDLIKNLQELAPDCVILNHYGPTETTIGVTTYRVEKGQSDNRSATPPIGRPIANTQVYILDQRLQPVPIWVPGELYIGGDNVTRGYLNRPELTAERFVRNPFTDDLEDRLYRTGDLARYLPDGNIEFLGRLDHQVKIRGFRIELREIETVLGQHPAVRETVILAREDTPGDKRLVAYVLSNRKSCPTAGELRSFLKTNLPDYMLPAAFVFLDALPLTPNGKVNRSALPAPDQIRPELECAFVSPRTSLEEALAGIWAGLLRLDQIGVHDNFFDLGGHSLLATQVVSRIRTAFQVELPLRSLFETPTIAELALTIARSRGAAARAEEMDHILAGIESLSDKEAKGLLSKEST